MWERDHPAVKKVKFILFIPLFLSACIATHETIAKAIANLGTLNLINSIKNYKGVLIFGDTPNKHTSRKLCFLFFTIP